MENREAVEQYVRWLMKSLSCKRNNGKTLLELHNEAMSAEIREHYGVNESDFTDDVLDFMSMIKQGIEYER